MNAFHSCKDTSDILPLYLPHQLFLKPWAKLNISLQLPNVTKIGKSISHWEIMEKLRDLIKPEQFSVLKVGKTTLEFVRFEAELETKKKLDYVVNRLDNKTIKLKNFSELMRIRAAPAKSDFPNRNTWDGFFNDAKDMDEMKPGERPDTIHLSNLPTKWFVPYHLAETENSLPSERIFYKIFEKFGPIRSVDIPICDPYRVKMKDHISGIKHCDWENKEFFEGYIQFKDYIGFTKCMDHLRDMKLVHKDEEESIAIDIKVDFDRTKHLSDASIRRREIVRDRLVKKHREKEALERDQLEEKRRKEEDEKKKESDEKRQKEQRRKLREEKRKLRILEKLKIKGADDINAKIAKEEKKLLKAQRKLESIRLIEELYRRIKERNEPVKVNLYNLEERQVDKELTKMKNSSELEYTNQKEKLNSAIKGRIVLKSMLHDKQYHDFSSSSSDDEAKTLNDFKKQKQKLPYPDVVPHTLNLYEPTPLWYGYPVPPSPAFYQQQIRPNLLFNYNGRGRGRYRGNSSRGYFPRRGRGYNRGSGSKYPPELEREYIKYFSKFLHEHDDRSETRSRSRSRYSYSRSRSRSSSRRRRRRSSTRSRSIGQSRRRRYKESRSRSRSNDRKKRHKSSTRSAHTPEPNREKARSRSVDSSGFISPKTMRKARSKSWSLPKEDGKKRKDSWSKSPEKK